MAAATLRVARIAARALGGRAAVVARLTADGVAVSAFGVHLDPAASPTREDLDGVDDRLLVGDLATDPRLAASIWGRLLPGTRAVALAPVRDGDRRVGVVAVLDTRVRAFSGDDAEMLGDLASLAAERTADELRADRLALLATSRAGEERYRLLFERAPDAIFILETAGDRVAKILEANAAACAMHGYTREELAGLDARVIIAPQGVGKARDDVRRVGEREWVAIDNFHVRKDGSRFPVEGVIGPLETGGERYAIVLVHDVTESRRARDALAAAHQKIEQELAERRRAEAAVRASEERYRLLFERAGEGILIASFEPDGGGAILDANAAACAMYGYTREELRRMQPRDLKAPEAAAGATERLHTVGGGEWTESITLHRRKDGSVFPVEGVLGPLDVGGRRYIIGFSHDITERTRAEQALAAAHEKLAQELVERERAQGLARAMVDHFPDGLVVLFDHDLRYTMAGGARVGELGDAHVVGRTLRERFSRASADDYEPMYRAALAGESRLCTRRLNGITYDVRTIPVTRADGSILGGMLVAQNVTPRVEAEAALREARDAAEAANRAKSVFLANMSHEIRTPMNAIMGFTQLLQRDPSLGPKQQQQLDIVTRSGEHLLALINDVLEMSKIEAGHRTLTRADLDLGALLDDLLRLFRLRAEAKRVAFEIEQEPRVPRRLVGDEGKLRQVLVNLLGNAVKFTEEGSVLVRVRVEGPPAAPRLQIGITDTGPGIAEDELHRLFQPFSQLRAGQVARGGTGLGLAISREFAQMMGGDITVESRLGSGSTFRLELPLEPARSSPPEVAEPPRGRVLGLSTGGVAPRVLVVDDDDDNRSWVRDLLREIGFDVREAPDGAAGLACFRAWHPALVLMDLNMPVMDGYAAIRAIRSTPGAPPVVIIAVTAVAFDDAREGIFAAGADGWLRKPCREGDLLEEVRRHLGIAYRHADSPPPEGPPPPHDTVGALPPELSARLLDAARIADFEGFHALLDQVPADHAHAADLLRRLVDGYAYERIAALLDPAG